MAEVSIPLDTTAAGSQPQIPKRCVLAYSSRRAAPRHEVQTNRAVSQWLARLQGLEFGGDYNPALHGAADFYLVPTQTIVGHDQRALLRLRGPDSLFGGFVEHEFIATKAIVHPLPDDDAIAPSGWAPEFSDRVGDVVLEGATVFSLADARRAAAKRLSRGPFRIKPIHACGGREQITVPDIDAFDALLANPSADALFGAGAVLEEELTDVETYSVGQIRLQDRLLSYYGRQYVTDDGRNGKAYGGSALVAVLGTYTELLTLEMEDGARQAIRQAQIFDAAADAVYPSFFASRRNYDIARGTDSRGRQRSGVLEQSWRMGCASRAEVVALHAFSERPSSTVVHARSVEVYHPQPLPGNAIEFFRGEDDEVGFIAKYAVADPL